MKEPI